MFLFLDEEKWCNKRIPGHPNLLDLYHYLVMLSQVLEEIHKRKKNGECCSGKHLKKSIFGQKTSEGY